MTAGVAIRTDGSGLVAAYARLKGISVATVVRNAAKDFVKAAYGKTPTAQISKSPYYTYVSWRTGKRVYLHESQVETEFTRTGKPKLAKKWKKFNPARGYVWMPQFKLRRVRVGKGWSKASWINAFRALGIPPKKRPARIPPKAETLSSVSAQGAAQKAQMTLLDFIRFNDFGKGADTRTAQIVAAGFAAGKAKIMKDGQRLLREKWRKQR